MSDSDVCGDPVPGLIGADDHDVAGDPALAVSEDDVAGDPVPLGPVEEPRRRRVTVAGGVGVFLLIATASPLAWPLEVARRRLQGGPPCQLDSGDDGAYVVGAIQGSWNLRSPQAVTGHAEDWISRVALQYAGRAEKLFGFIVYLAESAAAIQPYRVSVEHLQDNTMWEQIVDTVSRMPLRGGNGDLSTWMKAQGLPLGRLLPQLLRWEGLAFAQLDASANLGFHAVAITGRMARRLFTGLPRPSARVLANRLAAFVGADRMRRDALQRAVLARPLRGQPAFSTILRWVKATRHLQDFKKTSDEAAEDWMATFTQLSGGRARRNDGHTQTRCNCSRRPRND